MIRDVSQKLKIKCGTCFGLDLINGFEFPSAANDCLNIICFVLTLKEAPASKDDEGDEEVVGELVHAGDHHT